MPPQMSRWEWPPSCSLSGLDGSRNGTHNPPPRVPCFRCPECRASGTHRPATAEAMRQQGRRFIPGGSRQKLEDILEQRPGQELLTEQVVEVESRSRLQRSPLPARGTLSLVRPQQFDFTSSAIMPAPVWGVADVGLPSLAQGTLIAIVKGAGRRGHCSCSWAEIPADAGLTEAKQKQNFCHAQCPSVRARCGSLTLGFRSAPLADTAEHSPIVLANTVESLGG